MHILLNDAGVPHTNELYGSTSGSAPYPELIPANPNATGAPTVYLGPTILGMPRNQVLIALAVVALLIYLAKKD